MNTPVSFKSGDSVPDWLFRIEKTDHPESRIGTLSFVVDATVYEREGRYEVVHHNYEGVILVSGCPHCRVIGQSPPGSTQPVCLVYEPKPDYSGWDRKNVWPAPAS